MPEKDGSERRRFGRIDLERPLNGFIGAVPVDVVQLSIAGFRVLHETRFPPGDDHEIHLVWNGREMRFKCQVVRSTLFRLATKPGEKSLYQSGIRIDGAIGDSETVLRDLIADRVIRALEEQKANARGIPPVLPYTYQVGKGNRYRRCEFQDGKWRKFDTTRSDQPTDGFTISAEIAPALIETLCRTYEAMNAEGRRLTKMLAELSIRKSEGTPTRRYVP
ncbi:MAG TPA: hypothetical protein VM779_01440 [Thermoanaerobaculia bacterium]|nr:hypothetical protein [Thermoanaerobaculia bacterium]